MKNHETQLKRQIAWQELRNNFYGNISYDEKNAAAHERAHGHIDRPSVQRNTTRMHRNNLSAWDFYHKIIYPIDANLKRLIRSGEFSLHAKQCDKINKNIIPQMRGLTNLALGHDQV